jgi:hypothetical protein
VCSIEYRPTASPKGVKGCTPGNNFDENTVKKDESTVLSGVLLEVERKDVSNDKNLEQY